MVQDGWYPTYLDQEQKNNEREVITYKNKDFILKLPDPVVSLHFLHEI